MNDVPRTENRLIKLLQASGYLVSGVVEKASGLWNSYLLTRRHLPLPLDQELTQHYSSLLVAPLHNDDGRLSSISDTELCSHIRSETALLNLNNLTRTDAYLTIFKSFPELHWALLAHLVSRNGGWNMTDLRGQWHPQLLDEQKISLIFELLEACNCLIFSDAYPQLRLYIESKRIGRNLFYLLPQFGVSAFMVPFWNTFWQDGNPIPLTEALIINEQHFIQARVVEDDTYEHEIFHSLAFRSQPLLQLNQIVFPLWREPRAKRNIPLRLVGRVLENFRDLNERIEFGKCLYGILYGYPNILKAAIAFAERIPHTGSRADYWPHRFTPAHDHNNKADDTSELTDSTADPISSRWFSPSLLEAWPNRPLKQATEKDWYQDLNVLSHLTSIKLPRVIDMTHEHLFGQSKLQEAVLLERSFMKGASNRRTGRG
ncbi:DUF2515 family protein [Cohnella abietis]|uniref:DUF2515 domain-containing protein n=1 Tax=Cohnella abietis TaxID=2507935 RepID=A0A3T1DAG9_9BACL|nr:DUF2515 family protein [Cohnella abietis]BBI35116.1 hypothetical protein KCTCHS21_45150 [Cohnella abietis]